MNNTIKNDHNIMLVHHCYHYAIHTTIVVVKCIFFRLQFGVSVSYAIWACSKNFTIFVLARIVGGLCKGNVTISTAIVTDVTSTVNRGKGMVRFI